MEFTDYDTRLAAYAVVLDDAGRILLSWWNGEGRWEPGWTLPGGGIEFAEGVEEGVVREVFEETGLHIEVGAPMFVNTVTRDVSPLTDRPFRHVRIVYAGRVVGGELGTTEVGGSTDRAGWVPLAEAAATGRDLVVRAVAEMERARV